MRYFLRGFGFLIGLLIAITLAAFVYLQDADRLKPELEALIRSQSGIEVSILGDLTWELWPPLNLRVRNVSARQDDTTVTGEDVYLKLDVTAMWQDVEKWQIKELRLYNVIVVTPDATTTIESLQLADFRPGEPSPVSVTGSYLSAGPDQTPLSGSMQGVVTYTPQSSGQRERLVFSDADISSEVATGVCQLDISPAANVPASLPESNDDDLIPVATLLEYDLIADCDLKTLNIGTETFHDAALKVTNIAGAHLSYLEIRDFLGGSLIGELDIDLNAAPISWTIIPELDNVDSKRLLDWTERSFDWVANFAVVGEVRFTGNTVEAAATSVKAQHDFDGGQGSLDVSMLKQQLTTFAALADRADSIQRWPAQWQYQTFKGEWQIDGRKQVFQAVLDNLAIEAEGEVDWLSDSVDMLANVTFGPPLPDSPYRVNPLLEGTPLPIRCQGPRAEIRCRMDADATQKLIANALRRDSDTGLRKKLEDKIDEKVPEEYRDAARNLLDILGRALDN